jgi:tetratricopeptide (TPR) repeat protein
MIRKFRNIIWVALLALPVFLHAQSKELSDKDQRKFDYYFFEAERYKTIERSDLALQAFLECNKIDEENASVCFEIGRIYAAKKDVQNARVFFGKAYELDPDNKWIALETANFSIAIGDLKNATTIYEKLVQEYPEDISFKFELAQLYYNQKQFKKCIGVLNEVEVLLGSNEELSNQKKDIYLLLDDVVGAQNELEKLVATYPANVEYLGLLAQFYAANEEPDKALKTYRKMLVLAPTDPRAHLDLANIYKRQNQYDSSFVHLKIALVSPDLNIDNKIQVLFSFFQLSEKDTTIKKMAYELINISVASTPKEPKLYALLGDYQLRDNKLIEARNSFRKATRLGANQLQLWSEILILDARLNLNDSLAADGAICSDLYPNQPIGYLMAGIGNLQLQNLTNAVDYLEAGLDFVLDNPELEEQFCISLADAYNQLKEYAKSDAYFDKALEINPNSPTVLNNYAYYLSVRGVRLDDALEMTERCNKLAPDNGVFLDTWAWVLYKKGKYSDALDKIMACVKFGGGESGEVLEHWGDILFKLGRKEEAVAKWKESATKEDATKNINKKIENQQLYE